MQKINCTLTSFAITKLEYEIKVGRADEGIELNIEENLQVRQPKNPKTPSRMLELLVKINDADSRFKMLCTSKSIFTFDKTLNDEDFDSMVKSTCLPKAKERVYQAIKEISSAMGISPLDLS